MAASRALGSSPHTRGAQHGGLQRLVVLRIIPAYAGSTATTAALSCTTRDHPRIRGEHATSWGGPESGCGSSPHTRGARRPRGRIARICRIIPAYAGSTPRTDTTKVPNTDHPRIRGEHDGLPIAEWRRAGSSPHTRGALAVAHASTWPQRIIPAYAGSTCCRWAGSWTGTDHPRIRGEHVAHAGLDRADSGSSPHTRGALLFGRFYQRYARIIPAYAGSTRSRRSRRRWHGDHPRIRGEHPSVSHEIAAHGGSSPHTRGAHDTAKAESRQSGIIPAYAGSTVRTSRKLIDLADHPRIRGEHSGAARSSWRRRGSSPHTRGARPVRPRPGGAARIIPAYAGSTQEGVCSITCTPGSSPHTRGAPPGRPSTARIQRDHPRIRGEHVTPSSLRPSPSGSSPHTRGARHAEHAFDRRDGIIPAYAGSTHCRCQFPASHRDHPRIRGEHRKYQQDKAWRSGSSPHTRGARRRRRTIGTFRRIIPAYAGSTTQQQTVRLDIPDHPRIRGEHQHDVETSSSHTGSSPHTRGALPSVEAGAADLGIIPAYAGSTSRAPASCRRSWDHPRIRGEHVWAFLASVLMLGSSPHTRGARVENRPGLRRGRIIPAYAGSTVSAGRGRVGASDHPRIRGEHDPEAPLARIDAGSSPHTRGARSPGASPPLELRDHPRIRGEHASCQA